MLIIGILYDKNKNIIKKSTISFIIFKKNT